MPVAIRDSRLDLVSTVCRVISRLQADAGHALCNAIVAGQVDVLRAFLCRGANPPCFSAAHSNMLLRTEIRIDAGNYTHFSDCPLILIAAHCGRPWIVKELLDAKADPSRMGEVNGQPLTALFVAVRGGCLETCRALLKTVNDAARGFVLTSRWQLESPPTARERLRLEFYNELDRATPLLMAAEKGDADVLRELVGAGASMSAQRLSCNEVVHSDGGQYPFLAKYSNRDLDSLSLTPLGTCVYRRWPEESIHALLDMKADPGRTAAARSSSAEDAGLSPSSRGNRDHQQQAFPVEGPVGGDEIPLALLAATALIPLTSNAPVVICGLESEAGRKLNGLRGSTRSYDGSKDRWGVQVHDFSGAIPDSSTMLKAIKSENLRVVGDGTLYRHLTGASHESFMPQNCFYDPLTAHDSALARTKLLLQRGARPFSAPNSRYSFHEFFEELATNRVHRCHGPQYWVKLVKLFLQYEANPEATGQSLFLLFALIAAVARERAVTAEADKDGADSPSSIVLSITARAKLLLSDLGVDGAAVLRHAAASGRTDVVRAVAWFAPDVIMTDPERHRTALHCAAAAGHNEVVQLLSNDEAIVSAKRGFVEALDKEGHTALDLAARARALHETVVATLLRAGGQNKWGRCLDEGKRGLFKSRDNEGSISDDIGFGGEESRPLRKAFEDGEAVSGQNVGVAWQGQLRRLRKRWGVLLGSVEWASEEAVAREDRVKEAGPLEKIESPLVSEEGATVDSAGGTDEQGGVASGEQGVDAADRQNSVPATIARALHPSYHGSW